MTKKFLIVATFVVIIFGACLELRAQGKEELLFEEIPVVFAAVKHEQPVKEAPATVSIITADQIRRYGYRTLSEILRGVTGLYVTNDRNYEYLGVRGYFIPGDYSSRVLVLIDGHATNDGVTGSGPIGRELGIDVDLIKRIEIIKGPGSALYGTCALLGVINIITKDTEDLDGLKVTSQFGSYTLKEGIISYGKKIGGEIRLLISGSRMKIEGQDLYFPEFDDPQTNNGVFENGDWEKTYNFFAKLAYRDIELKGGFNSREKGIPTAGWGTVFNDNRSKTIDGYRFVELKYARNLGKTKELVSRIYYRRCFYDADYISWYEDEFEEEYKEDFVDYLRNDWLGSELQLNWSVSQEDLLIIGGEYQYHFRIYQRGYDQGLLGPDYYYEYLNDKRKMRIWSIYLQNIYQLRENISFVLGGRYDRYSTFGKTLNPRVGIVYHLYKRSTIKFLYGTAFRAPSNYELYYHDGYLSMKPNPDLIPEKLKTYEAVFEQGIGENMQGGLSLYRTDLSNIIYQVESQELSASTGEALLEFVNVGKAKAAGVELNLKGKWRNLELHAGYNHQEAKDKLTNKELVNSPKNSGNLGISIPFLQGKFYLTAEFQYLGKRLTVGENREWVDPYLRTDLTLFSSKIIPNTEIIAKINDLFNISYSDPVSNEFKQAEIPQDHRNIFLKIAYKM